MPCQHDWDSTCIHGWSCDFCRCNETPPDGTPSAARGLTPTT